MKLANPGNWLKGVKIGRKWAKFVASGKNRFKAEIVLYNQTYSYKLLNLTLNIIIYSPSLEQGCHQRDLRQH